MRRHLREATVDLGEVRRVKTANGSHIEPPLEQWWSDLDKLRWQAAVVRVDAGVTVRVGAGGYTVNGKEQRGYYSLMSDRGSSGPFTFGSAWTYLNGVATGAELARMQNEATR